MKRMIMVGFVLALLALSAAQVFALQTGTWTCMGYTITITPDDADNPNLSGTIAIFKSDDCATIDVSGTYLRSEGKRPATVVSVAGTITTEDGIIDVAREFTFQPGPQKTVWKTILSWLESEIAS